MIYAITQFVKFDVEKEKERLNTVFSDAILERQLNILQLFLDGKYKECYHAMAMLPYDEENECDEAEYVHTFIFENVRAVIEYPNIKIEPVYESESTDTKAKD